MENKRQNFFKKLFKILRRILHVFFIFSLLLLMYLYIYNIFNILDFIHNKILQLALYIIQKIENSPPPEPLKPLPQYYVLYSLGIAFLIAVGQTVYLYWSVLMIHWNHFKVKLMYLFTYYSKYYFFAVDLVISKRQNKHLNYILRKVAVMAIKSKEMNKFVLYLSIMIVRILFFIDSKYSFALMKAHVNSVKFVIIYLLVFLLLLLIQNLSILILYKLFHYILYFIL